LTLLLAQIAQPGNQDQAQLYYKLYGYLAELGAAGVLSGDGPYAQQAQQEIQYANLFSPTGSFRAFLNAAEICVYQSNVGNDPSGAVASWVNSFLNAINGAIGSGGSNSALSSMQSMVAGDATMQPWNLWTSQDGAEPVDGGQYLFWIDSSSGNLHMSVPIEGGALQANFDGSVQMATMLQIIFGNQIQTGNGSTLNQSGFSSSGLMDISGSSIWNEIMAEVGPNADPAEILGLLMFAMNDSYFSTEQTGLGNQMNDASNLLNQYLTPIQTLLGSAASFTDTDAKQFAEYLAQAAALINSDPAYSQIAASFNSTLKSILNISSGVSSGTGTTYTLGQIMENYLSGTPFPATPPSGGSYPPNGSPSGTATTTWPIGVDSWSKLLAYGFQTYIGSSESPTPPTGTAPTPPTFPTGGPSAEYTALNNALTQLSALPSSLSTTAQSASAFLTQVQNANAKLLSMFTDPTQPGSIPNLILQGIIANDISH
jgi:hypothetical protein